MLRTADDTLPDIISSAVASEQDDKARGAVLTFVLRIQPEQTWLSMTKAMPLAVGTSPFSLITLNFRQERTFEYMVDWTLLNQLSH